MVESAALEMRCTHYVVPGVRIPHSPQKKGCPNGHPFLLLGYEGFSVSIYHNLPLKYTKQFADEGIMLPNLLLYQQNLPLILD